MARTFNGSNQYLGNTNAALATLPCTMACWFNPGDLTANRRLMAFGQDAGYEYQSLGHYSNGKVYAWSYEGVASKTAYSTISATEDIWNHGCAVWASESARYAYLNGGNKGQDTNTVTGVDVDNTSIGCRIYNGPSPTEYFIGSIAEAAVWNVALTDAEVIVLAKGISPLAVRPGNLVFYIPLIRDNDQDIVGGLSMTQHNTPTITEHPPIRYPFTPFYYMVSGAEPPADLSIDIGLDEAAYQGTGVRII